METRTVTLREAADILHEQGIEIEWENGKSTLQDFFSYFDHHYRKLCEERKIPPHVIFFFSDLLEIFK